MRGELIMAQLKSTIVNDNLTINNGVIIGGYLKPGDTWSAIYWGSCNRWRNSVLC